MRGRGVGAMFWLTTVDAPRLSIYVKVIARDRSLKCGLCSLCTEVYTPGIIGIVNVVQQCSLINAVI